MKILTTKETANLTLRTWDILPQNQILNDTNNSIGSIYGNGGYLVWKNINLINVIGKDMWDKYDNFNLFLKIYGYRASTPNTGTTAPNAHRHPSIWISGLSWTNGKIENCYNMNSTNTQSSDAFFLLSKTKISFNKLRPIVDITIEFKTTTNNSVNGFNEKPNYMFGHHTFVFNIIPVKKIS